jgi:hypothetical protein
MAAIARGWTGSANNTAAATSLTIDITGATVGEFVLAWCQTRSSVTNQAITGWTKIGVAVALGNSTANGVQTLFIRKKVAGDTTFSLTWTTSGQHEVILGQWTGVNQVLTQEQYTTATITGATGNVFTSPTATPSFADRWAVVSLTAGNGDSAHKTITWTPPTGMTEVGHITNPNTATLWNGLGVFDSGGAVTAAAHSYAGTASNSGGLSMTNGSSSIIYLIPQEQVVTMAGASSLESFGLPSGNPGVVSATMAALASAEAMGTPTTSTTSGGVSATMVGVATAEAFGPFSVTPGAASATMAGIATAEALGVLSNSMTAPSFVGLATAETFGTFSRVPGPVSLTMVAIASAQAMGNIFGQVNFTHSFENGTNGSGVVASTPTDGSSKFDISQVTGASATITIDTTWAHRGTRSFKSVVAADTAASAGWSSSVLGSLGPHVLVRSYHRWTGTPPDKSRFFTLRDTGGGFLAPRMNNDGSIDVSNPQDGSVVSATAANQFPLTGTHTARVEIDVDVSSGTSVPFTLRIWYDSNMESTGTADTVLTGTLAAAHSDVNSMYFGLTYPSGTTPTFNLWTDDIAVRSSLVADIIGPPGVSDQTMDVAAVSSAEAFGLPSLSPGAVSTTMAGIATAQALGLPSVFVPISVTMVGIASAEAEGVISATPGGTSATMVGVASAEGMGLISATPGAVQLTMVGVSSAEEFGLLTRTPGGVSATPLSVASAEALGLFAVTPGAVSVTMVGIATSEALGLPTRTPGAVSATMVAIASAEALGLFSVTAGAASATMVAVASAEAFGLFTATYGGASATLVGIATAEAVGTPSVSPGGVSTTLVGIPSAEAVQPFSAAASYLAQMIGITPAEAFGLITITSTISSSLVAVSSAEVVNVFTVASGAVVAQMVAISSAEFVNTFTASSGGALAQMVGVGSTEFVSPFITVVGGVSETMAGKASDEAFGVWNANIGAVTATMEGVASAESVQMFSVTAGGTTVSFPGIVSQEAVGLPDTYLLYAINMLGIASEEDVSPLGPSIYAQLIFPDPIASEEDFGEFSFGLIATRFMIGVATQAAVGTPQIILLAIIGYYNGDMIVLLSNGTAALVDSRGTVTIPDHAGTTFTDEDDYGRATVVSGTTGFSINAESGKVRVT